jgi:hypothetical protein
VEFKLAKNAQLKRNLENQVTSDKKKRGRRLSAGRRAKKAGLSIEFRYGENFMAVRRIRESTEGRHVLTREEIMNAPDEPRSGRRRKKADD